MCKLYLQPKFTKVSTEFLSMILETNYNFIRVRYSGRERTVAPWTRRINALQSRRLIL